MNTSSAQQEATSAPCHFNAVAPSEIIAFVRSSCELFKEFQSFKHETLLKLESLTRHFDAMKAKGMLILDAVQPYMLVHHAAQRSMPVQANSHDDASWQSADFDDIDVDDASLPAIAAAVGSSRTMHDNESTSQEASPQRSSQLRKCAVVLKRTNKRRIRKLTAPTPLHRKSAAICSSARNVSAQDAGDRRERPATVQIISSDSSDSDQSSFVSSDDSESGDEQPKHKRQQRRQLSISSKYDIFDDERDDEVAMSPASSSGQSSTHNIMFYLFMYRSEISNKI